MSSVPLILPGAAALARLAPSPVRPAARAICPSSRPVGDAALRVALFSGNYNCVRDGANRALNRLIGHVLSRGHGARVYSPAIAEPAFAPAGDLVPVASLAIPGRPEYRLAPRLPGAAAADVRGFAPDIVHVSAPDGLNAGAIRLARRMGVPVVASMHTRFETYFEYYGLGLLRRPAEAWLRRFYNRCDMVLVPNAGIADEMRAGGVTSPMRIWSRGVDPRQFSPAWRDDGWRRRMGIAPHEVAVLFFGRLVAEKGLAMYEAVIAGLRARGLRVRPLVIGDGPERDRFARRLEGAVMTGHLGGEALGRAVASADLFVNPSLTEAFGNVTLEAMASGVPVVAADVAATRALIDDGQSGLLVSPRDTVAYVEAAATLIADRGRAAALAGAALAATRSFDWPATLDAVIAGYRSAALSANRA
ncbi:glycosyltransferase family 4 protein [Sphingomonas carotinifaciens]|uniref:Glycosyltransferase involved in cell wall bisynthesis n=1 Tax=Sphingomonas carotinifaciens TaxID=1166323 RepID=A0A1G7MIN2_9SPHN|nr:glycosyltransferase family 1 protein [Sphingomonas carotinifaciens]MBB4086799.1 glycosyltransferase involved in cell wall biosynthesis [Sphingomonas carotinifaciens]SDF61571.1 Glycosyltransferase involved in cell wall bisynthesis [Sphingomonas carotinifaciens]